MNPLPPLIRPWLTSISSIEWLNFRPSGLGSIRYLRDIRLNLPLLQAAIAYWDPTVHVFRFGLNELCPTVEEFAAYLRGFQSEVPIIPELNKSMSRVLRSKLGLSSGAATFATRGDTLNIPYLITEFGPVGDEDDLNWQSRRRFALSICVLAAYFLVSSFGPVNPMLVGIAEQIGQRKNVVPLILGETLVGLDQVQAGATPTFGGSPLLLQLWLCDKLNLLHPPSPNYMQQRGQFYNREYRYNVLTLTEWEEFLLYMNVEEIIWRVPWLDLPDMTISSAHFNQMVIPSTTRFTFYIPGRFTRQLGMTQGRNQAYFATFEIPPFTMQRLNAFQHLWGNRTLHAADPEFNPVLSRRYLSWLQRDLMARGQNNSNDTDSD